LRRSRCQVRGHEKNAIQVLYRGDVPYGAGIKERQLQMAQTEAFET
jgi:hypothetical protein